MKTTVSFGPEIAQPQYTYQQMINRAGVYKKFEGPYSSTSRFIITPKINIYVDINGDFAPLNTTVWKNTIFIEAEPVTLEFKN